jgi:hypothetical protein
MDQLASQSYNKAFDKMGNVTNVEEMVKGQTYSKLADELSNRAFGSNTNPLPLTQDAKDAIIGKLAPVKDINPDVFNKYVADVSSAKNVQDLRSLQAPMVRGSKAVQAAGNIGATKGLAASDIARATVGIAKNPVSGLAQVAMASPMADRAASSTLAGLSKVTGSKTANTLAGLLPRIGAIGTAQAVAGNTGKTGLPTESVQPGQPAATGANMTQGATMNPSTNQSTLSQLYQTLLAQEQSGAGLTPNTGSLVSALNTLAPQVQKQQLAVPALAGLSSEYQQAPTGLLGALEGMIPGTAAQQYQQAASSAQPLVASALGIPSNEAGGLLPGLLNTTSAAQRQGVINQLLQALGATPAVAAAPAGQ